MSVGKTAQPGAEATEIAALGLLVQPPPTEVPATV